jgi:nitrate reductase NapE component
MLKYVKRSNEERSNVKQRLLLIIALYLILAISYSIVVPIGRGADEWAHYWYAQFIADHARLPANPAEREAAGYKSDWPPLYHLFAAAITGWIDTAGPPTLKYRPDTPAGAGHIRRQLVPAQGPEAILHTEDELFPWRQEILVWHLGRFLSIAFSAGTLLITYFIALEVFSSSKVAGSRKAGEQAKRPNEARSRGAEENHAPPTRAKPPLGTHHAPHLLSPQTLALICVAFLAFIPRFLFTGMLFSYDSLTLLLASLFLWLVLRVANGHYPRWGFWALGGLAGLALLTKYLTALLPLEIVALVLSRGAERQRGKGDTLNSPLPPRPSAPLLKLGQALLALLLVTSIWFGYLLLNFNEIDTYGPVLGTLAPLLRGDGSDRTVEQIFALMSGGQAPPPAHIETQSYTPWQIMAEFPTTFWGNPITRPYPLNWFVGAMTIIATGAVVGLVLWWRTPLASSPPRLTCPRMGVVSLLMLHCLLPLPFMAIRLFGARDALEAVQGRHLLFLSGPAIAVLVIWGLSHLISYASRITFYVLRFTFYVLISLLLLGAIGQLIYMQQVYAPLLPVQTTPYQAGREIAPPFTLEGGSRLIDYQVTSAIGTTSWLPRFLASSPPPIALKVSLIWQAGTKPAPEDYRLELALVDGRGNVQSNWLAYQTQARYPTRAWEEGDIIRDEGWLPLLGLAAGEYTIQWRLLAETGQIIPWQPLSTYLLNEPAQSRSSAQPEWLLWQQGEMISHPPLVQERETAQFTLSNLQSPIPQGHDVSNPHLIGPDNRPYLPTSAGSTWANFIIGPSWPPGDYRWQSDGQVVLRVAENQRNFDPPAITYPLEANFEDQVKLLGYELPTRRVQPGDGLPVTLYWQGLRWMSEDFVIFSRLLDNEGAAWGGYDRRAQENYSTLLWAPGEVITDGFAVPIAPDAPAGIYRLNLGWYRQINGSAQSLPLLNPETGQPVEATAVTIGPIKVGGPPPGITVDEVRPQAEVNIALGEQIKLLGFDMENQQISEATNGEPSNSSNPPIFQSSNPLHLMLYWQALAAPKADYTVFTHLRNAAGETVAQKDGPPASGAYPTGLWAAGEIIKDEISIPLEGVEPGQYSLVVGMYDFATGLRLPVANSPDGTILLESFEVGQ